MDIKLKTRMPLMVQNMINDLKVKCPRYAQCKYRGTLRGLAEHEVSCKNNAKNKIGVKVKECPLKYIGCTSFNGGYLNKHYDEYQQQHLDIVINYFESKMNKMEKKYMAKLNELKKENVELRDEIKEIHIVKDEISAELLNLHSQIKKMQQKQNDYKIVVNTPPTNKMQIEEPQKSEEWNSFINAHRRLSTKTGATIPETEKNNSGVYSNNANRLNLLSQQTQSFATQNTSIRTNAISEGWYHKLPNHPLVEPSDKNGNKLQNETKKSKSKHSKKSSNKSNKKQQIEKENQSHSTQGTQTETDDANTMVKIIDIDDDDDTIKTNTTNSTITNTTTTARVNRINAKLKSLKQKQERKKLQKRKQKPKISLLDESHSPLAPYAYNITVNESETSDLSLRDIDESSSVSNQRKNVTHRSYSHRMNNKTMQKLQSQFMSHSYQPQYVQNNKSSAITDPSILSITDSAQSPPIQRPITPYQSNISSFPGDDVYDDMDDLTVTSKNDTNYSCTISVRRAIQHLVPNYC